MTNITQYAHTRILQHITKDSLVIDATAGNGHDTLFLARHANHVIAFDIQDKALKATNQNLKSAALTNVSLIHDSHEHIEKHVKDPIDAVVFNLGYLPGSDKQITTMATTTIKALKASLACLNAGGIIVITIYLGHDEGKKEALDIDNFSQTLSPKHYTVLKFNIINRHCAPYIIEIQKH